MRGASTNSALFFPFWRDKKTLLLQRHLVQARMYLFFHVFLWESHSKWKGSQKKKIESAQIPKATKARKYPPSLIIWIPPPFLSEKLGQICPPPRPYLFCLCAKSPSRKPPKGVKGKRERELICVSPAAFSASTQRAIPPPPPPPSPVQKFPPPTHRSPHTTQPLPCN